jgi:protein-L-isoaspartate(D-aspartate) O-methyltransferase
MSKRYLIALTLIILVVLIGASRVLGCVRLAPAPSPIALPTPQPVVETPIPPQTPTPPAPPAPEDPFSTARAVMVREQIAARGVRDEAVLIVMGQVPRHRFVPDQYLPVAYGDHPLPIGYGQTISQPYIVALMTEALKVEAGDRVLEIGTGSGYQAAVLAELGVEVYTIEIIPELTREAEQRLRTLGYTDVQVLNADGYYGWEEHAPFDAIIVTAAPDHLPQPLANQLREGGRLIIPIGPQGSYQTLWLFEKQGGELSATNLGGVRFVPLTGEH